MNNTSLENLEAMISEGFKNMEFHMQRMSKKIDILDERIKRIEWILTSHKREFEVLHGFNAQSAEQIYDLYEKIGQAAPVVSV